MGIPPNQVLIRVTVRFLRYKNNFKCYVYKHNLEYTSHRAIEYPSYEILSPISLQHCRFILDIYYHKQWYPLQSLSVV